MKAPSRRRLDVLDTSAFHPRYVVWELTLACDQPCTHCGSRAGVAREGEVSTERALALCAELADMGAQEVVLIGGEAYLHPGFLEIVAALAAHGVTPVMTTGGRGVTAELARAMREAGLERASVSIDGLAPTHDTMRAARGSFASATSALQYMHNAGIRVHANTNVNRFNQGDLEALYEHLRTCHVESWQIQLTSPLGRAADRPEMLLQPYDLLTLVPRIAALKERAFADGLLVLPGNNLGYFGPEEALLRSPEAGGGDHWLGCQAGRYVMGIESDGAVKGCPSLQTTHYVGGNVRDASLRAVWNDAPQLAFARARTVDALWGFCRTCDFAATCLGGCTFTAHSFFGKPGNNPYCHYRARRMQQRGLRERLVLRAPAPNRPFDHALFDLVEEPWGAPGAPPEPAASLKVRRLPLAPSTSHDS